jgi:GNAT superfamily N-acetyltransferase
MATSTSFIENAIHSNRANFLLKASAWATADPLFSVKQFDGASAVFSGSSTDTFNVLVLERDTKRPAFEIIEEARESFFGENRFAVWSWQDGQLQDLPVDKSAIEDHLIMACEVEDLSKPPADRKRLDATLATEPLHLMDAGTVIGAIFGEAEEGFMIQSVFAGQDDVSLGKLLTKILVAYEGGKAIATASYIECEGNAGIYDVAVLPAEQKKGVGSRMFHTALASAAKAGAKTITLQASPEGAGIYERAGLQTLGFCWSIDIS